MNKSVSFAKLDLITVKPYLTIKNLLLLTLVACFMGFSTGNTSTIIAMVMIYGSIYVTYPFAVGEKNGIDMLYSTLTLKRDNVVIGRYIFALMLNLAVTAFSFITSYAVMTIFNKGYNLHETLLTILSCFLIFTIVQAFQLPIYFKLGYTKAKFLAYLPLIAFPTAVVFASSLLDKEVFMIKLVGVADWISSNPEAVLAVTFILWVIVCVISCRLSCRFYKKREF